jgi:hypothetical protein
MKKRLSDADLRAKIARLPLWIQDVANAALRERDEMKEKMERQFERQKPTPFYVAEYGTGGTLKTYIDTNSIHVEHAGIQLEASVGRSGRGEDCISLRFDAIPHGIQDVVIIPLSSNAIEFRAAEHLRQSPLRKKKKK